MEKNKGQDDDDKVPVRGSKTEDDDRRAPASTDTFRRAEVYVRHLRPQTQIQYSLQLQTMQLGRLWFLL